jgi:hypothetical protein
MPDNQILNTLIDFAKEVGKFFSMTTAYIGGVVIRSCKAIADRIGKIIIKIGRTGGSIGETDTNLIGKALISFFKNKILPLLKNMALPVLLSLLVFVFFFFF